MLPLLQQQDTEMMPDIEAVPFDPDWDRYFEYERLGLHHLLTARADGVLVGYVNCLVIHSLLCRSVVHGYAEHFWLAPEWRGGGTGRVLLEEAERGMVERGAKVCRFDTNDLFDPDEHGRSRVGLILRRMGYRPIVTVWQKVIEHVRRRKSAG